MARRNIILLSQAVYFRLAFVVPFAVATISFSSSAIASDAIILDTHSICRSPDLRYEQVEAQLGSAGWVKPTKASSRKAVARHIAAGKHYSKSGNWKTSWRSDTKIYANRNGGQVITNDDSTTTRRQELYLVDKPVPLYLVVEEDKVVSNQGALKFFGRTCLLVTPPSAATDALQNLGTERRNWRELPRKSLRASGRSFAISGRYKSMRASALPFRTKATEFTQIKVVSDR